MGSSFRKREGKVLQIYLNGRIYEMSSQYFNVTQQGGLVICGEDKDRKRIAGYFIFIKKVVKLI